MRRTACGIRRGLFLLWSEAEYNFAYWDKRSEVDRNARCREFLPVVMAAELGRIKVIRQFPGLCHIADSGEGIVIALAGDAIEVL